MGKGGGGWGRKTARRKVFREPGLFNYSTRQEGMSNFHLMWSVSMPPSRPQHGSRATEGVLILSDMAVLLSHRTKA